VKKVQRFTDPWSPSKLSCWEQCPRQFKYKYVEKIPEGPSGPAAERGTMLHGQAEGFINGTLPLNSQLKQVKPLLVQLKKAHVKKRVMLELNLGFDHKWKRTKDWFTKDTWVRVKMDVAWLVDEESTRVIDWKTGKFKPEDPAYNDQLSIYAVASLASGWGIKTTAQLVFTDHGEVVERPSGVMNLEMYCRWCAYSTAKGGKCDF
jgi:hypothetical protein